ncbi:MGA_1079 family surface serine endopeptidase [Mycoplasma sp. Sp33II]|uniref:MGA_1079 family surface serine endopeptidase n=1 Tax=unclassified Mycoplasma TaxID=2683645 RepID=UPI003AAD9DE1
MRKRNLIKNIAILASASSLALLAASCTDQSAPVQDKDNAYQIQLKLDKEQIQLELNSSASFINNNLVSGVKLNDLINQIDQYLSLKNITKTQYDDLSSKIANELQAFKKQVTTAQDNLVNSIKNLVAKLSVLNSEHTGIELLNQIRVATQKATSDLELKNVDQLLQDQKTLQDLLAQVARETSSAAHNEINTLISQIDDALANKRIYLSNSLVNANALNELKDELLQLNQQADISTQEVAGSTSKVQLAIQAFNKEAEVALNKLVEKVTALKTTLASVNTENMQEALKQEISQAILKAVKDIEAKNLEQLLLDQSKITNLLSIIQDQNLKALKNQYQTLLLSLQSVLTQNNFYVKNDLVNASDLNNLIATLNQNILSNNISEQQYQELANSANELKEKFLQACHTALSNTITSLKNKINLFTEEILSNVSKETKEEIKSTITNSQNDITNNNLANILSDITKLSDLYDRAISEGDSSKAQINKLKQRIEALNSKVANFKVKYGNYPELLGLIESNVKLDYDLTAQNVSAISTELQKAENNFAAITLEANAINYDAEFKTWLATHTGLNQQLTSLAQSIISSFENNFKQGKILSESQINNIKQAFDLNVAEFKKQYQQTVGNSYETAYNDVNNLIKRLLALPSTHNQATTYQSKLLITPETFASLSESQKAQAFQSVQNLSTEILSQYPANVIQLKEQGQNAINLILNPKATAGDKGYDLNVNSASINSKNFDLYLLQTNKNNEITISSKEFQLNPDNFDLLQVKYNLVSQNTSTYILKNVEFPTKLTAKINSINYSNIEDLYNINYNAINSQYQDDFTTHLNENFLAQITPKEAKIEQYFTYQLVPNSVQFTNNKFTLQVTIKYKQQTIKTLTLTSKQSPSFQNPLNRKVRVSIQNSLSNNPYFKNNQPNNLLYAIAQLFIRALYRQDPNSTTGFNANDWTYVENLMSTQNLPSRYSGVNNPQKMQLLQNALHNAVNLSLEGYNNWELINYSQSNIFVYNDRMHAATFKVKFTGPNKEPFIYELKIQTANRAKNYQDNLEIFQLSDYLKKTSEILSKATIKDPKVTHSNFYAGEGITKLNELYTLPSFGKYQIIFDVTDPKNYRVDNVAGSANIRFAVTLNGQVVNNNLLKSPEFKLNFFRPLRYTDIKPKNNKAWFTAEDFASVGSNQQVKDKIALINSHNFEYQTLFGKRVFDANTLMEEQAFDKLNYLFKFKGEKAAENNNGKFDNNGYDQVDKGPSAPTQPNTNNIANPSDQAHTVDPNSLLGSYFVYYYDVKASYNQRHRVSSMTFKVGFINKWNWNDRYTTGEIILRNLKNDFADEFYPEIMLNKISNDNLSFSSIAGILPSEFAQNVKNKSSSLWSLNVRVPSYKGYSLYPQNFSIADVQMVDDKNGRAMIRIAYQQRPEVGGRKYIGDVWYEVSGFRANPNAADVSYSDDELLKLPFNQKMKKIVRSNGDVLRVRGNEITARDNYWLLNKTTGKIEYTLPNKYFKPILDQDNKQAKVKIHLDANIKFLDSLSYARVYGFTDGRPGGIWLSFNYNDLKTKGKAVIKQTTDPVRPNGNGTPLSIAYTMTVTLQEDGMHFEFGLDNPNYKIVQNNPVALLYQPPFFFVPNHLQNKFDANEAFFFDYFAGNITYEYINNVANEDFGNANSTNVISYKNMDYTQENMPIVLSNKDSFSDPFKYNPNQMLSYKLQDGYKFNNEYLNRSYVATSPVAKDLMSRSFAMNYGSAMMVAKVNSDPNDGRFYILTNHHVINNDKNNLTPEKSTLNAGTTPTIAGLDFGNNVNAGFSYWDGLYTQGTKAQVVWSGINQIGLSSNFDPRTQVFKTGILETNRFLDVSLIIFDINPMIKNLKADGKYQTAAWYQNWFNLKNLNYLPFLNNESPNRNKNVQHGLFNGFPYGKQSTYIIHRDERGYEVDSFRKQTPYEPTYYNAGNSGTGVMNNNGEYVTTINSGGPLWLLVGKNGAYNTGKESFNFYGVNEEGTNPLDQLNYHSMARNIMRMNAFDPDLYDIPWFFKKWTK